MLSSLLLCSTVGTVLSVKPEGVPGWGTSADAPVCPCSNTSLCAPITRTGGENVFAFHLETDNYSPTAAQVWRQYDWDLLTTVCVFGKLDPELLCYAHSKNVRVTLGSTGPRGWDNWANRTDNAQWISSQVAGMAAGFTDGINIDIEQGVTNDSRIPALTGLVENVTAALRAVNPAAQVSFDAPSMGLRPASGECGQDYNRRYDYAGIAAAVDFLVTMDYDTNIYWAQRYKLFPQYYANNALPVLQNGVACLTEHMSVPATKIVLAFPWYAYRYSCAPGDVPPACNFKTLGQIAAVEAIALVTNGTATRVWQDNSSTPYLFYTDNSTLYRIDYDDSESLRLKYTFAKKAGVRGIGMWTASSLNYTDTPRYTQFWSDLALFSNSTM